MLTVTGTGLYFRQGVAQVHPDLSLLPETSCRSRKNRVYGATGANAFAAGIMFTRLSRGVLMRQFVLRLCLLVAAFVICPTPAPAQYFGKNKVQYSRFDWKVLETEHFHVYYYESEAQAAVD